MQIKSALKDYEIEFWREGKSLIEELVKIPNSFWVIDQKVYDLYKKEMFGILDESKLFTFDALETNKCLDTALEICEKMTDLPGKRNATLISVGGGITQDITGFAANILYRGIHWIFIPTTLLAACDSCIGGKTSLNYKSYKNLLGTFFPPEKINIVPTMFETLSEKDFLSGLGEVVKFNIMAGAGRLDQIEAEMPKLLARDAETVERYVHTSLEFKKNFIEIDEFDQGERIKLNFAHTFGHAFETLSKYEIPHGTAVAMGMIVANRISYKRNWLTLDQVVKMENLLEQIIKVNQDCIDGDGEILLGAIKKDKKQVGTSTTAVLMHEDMSLEIVRDVTNDEIFDAINEMKKVLG